MLHQAFQSSWFRICYFFHVSRGFLGCGLVHALAHLDVAGCAEQVVWIPLAQVGTLQGKFYRDALTEQPCPVLLHTPVGTRWDWLSWPESTVTKCTPSHGVILILHRLCPPTHGADQMGCGARLESDYAAVQGICSPKFDGCVE